MTNYSKPSGDDLSKIFSPEDLDFNNLDLDDVKAKPNKVTPKTDTTKVPEELIDYYALAKANKLHEVQHRQTILYKILTVLATKQSSNALLLGEAGVGKTAIVKDLALRLYRHDPIITQMLGANTRIFELPLQNLVAGNSYVGMLEAAVNKILTYVRDSKYDIILYFDEVHQLFSNSELRKIPNLLKPALADGSLKVIAATTTQESKLLLEDNAFLRRFSTIDVPELTNAETLDILVNLRQQETFKQNLTLTDATLNKIIAVSNQYAQTNNQYRPASAVKLFYQALAVAKLRFIVNYNPNNTKNVTSPMKLVTDKDVEQAANQNFSGKRTIDNQHVKELEQRLEQFIIGQSAAKKAVMRIAHSLNLNLIPRKTPHSILFTGPTGVGKTEVAKQLARCLFGTETALINLNMTEYNSSASVNRLIGSPRGYVGSKSTQPLPLDTLRTNPFQLVLLDEFEKAHPAVQRLFMQALDEGYLTLNDQSRLDFSHALIIATTNAGCKILTRQSVGFNTNATPSKQEIAAALAKDFPPELLNRFEQIIPFTPTTFDEYCSIVALKYNNLVKQLKANHSPYKLTPPKATGETPFIKSLAKTSFDPTKNGRPAQRTILEYVEKRILESKQEKAKAKAKLD